MYGLLASYYQYSESDPAYYYSHCNNSFNNNINYFPLQLKVYVQEQSITAHVDDSYAASAINEDLFDMEVKDYGNDRDYLAVYFNIIYPVIILICMLGIIILLMALFVCVRKHRYSGESKRVRFQKLTRRFRAGIINFAIISFIRLIFILAMDGAAVGYTHDSTENETKELINNRIYDKHLRALYFIPHIVSFCDILISIAYVVIVIVAVRSHFRAKQSNDQDDKQQRKDRIYYTLGLTIVCPILSFFIHLPFIAVADLNDAIYAGSIFSFYTVVTILEFIILEFILISCFRLPKPSQMLETKVINIPYCGQLFTKTLLTALVVVLCLSFLYLLVAITVCFFYYLPIVQSLSRSSNQVIVIYQTGLIFLGAGVMYRTVFRKTTPLIKVLKRKEIGDMVSKSETEEWEASTDEEKLVDFYSFMITDVIGNFSRAPVSVPREGRQVLDNDGQICRNRRYKRHVVEPTNTRGIFGNDNTIIELEMID